jgi:hypothetical protein
MQQMQVLRANSALHSLPVQACSQHIVQTCHIPQVLQSTCLARSNTPHVHSSRCHKGSLTQATAGPNSMHLRNMCPARRNRSSQRLEL